MRFSRFLRHIFGILVWLMLLFLVVILYYYSIQYISLSPQVLGTIDTVYQVVKLILIAGLISSVISVVFYYIRHSRVIDTKLIRRFLPIIQFTINLLTWVVIGFMILEALHINTRNIMTGAGIGGAILALAYKDLFTNLLGSLSILFSKTFEIGDTIRVRTARLWIEWMVEEITLNHTKVTNNTGEVVYVPNKIIYSEPVENLSRRRFFNYEILLPIAKTTESEEVANILDIIEWKINSFYPMEVLYSVSNPNATDLLYTINIKLPEENTFFETEMRKFLVTYVFSRGIKKASIGEAPIITGDGDT